MVFKEQLLRATTGVVASVTAAATAYGFVRTGIDFESAVAGTGVLIAGSFESARRLIGSRVGGSPDEGPRYTPTALEGRAAVRGEMPGTVVEAPTAAEADGGAWSPPPVPPGAASPVPEQRA